MARRTNKRAAQAEPVSDDVGAEDAMPQSSGGEDDDDAPEEVTLATSKSAASTRRQQESSQAQAQQTGRREAAASRREQAQRRKEQRGQVEDARQQPASTSGRREDADEGLDLLPESVTTALALQRRRRAEAARQLQADAVAAALQQDKLDRSVKRKRTPLVAVQEGPVTVTVLKAATQRTAGSGAHFLREQLYDSKRLARSTEMLRAPRGALAQRASLVHRFQPSPDFV